MRIETITTAGKAAVVQAIALYRSRKPSIMFEDEMALLEHLKKAGDEHAKVLRGMVVYLKIEAPRYWWVEMDTYRIGVECLGSESTMNKEARGLRGIELQKAKANISEGLKQTRVLMFSYQALRRIYRQRRRHRLPEWQDFCKYIETLPYFDMLIR